VRQSAAADSAPPVHALLACDSPDELDDDAMSTSSMFEELP
jgi:hypothetical protein